MHCIIGSNASGLNPVIRGNTSAKVPGNAPQVRKTENFNCDKIGYGGAGYLTNDRSTGNPLRLKPLELILNTDSVKKDYYYGEKLETERFNSNYRSRTSLWQSAYMMWIRHFLRTKPAHIQ
ncbi:MAG: hypothetical protein V8S14_07590 [Lachnospiraceae bacterium]